MPNFRLSFLLLSLICVLSIVPYCTAENTTSQLQFDNPDLAYDILTKLDIFESRKPSSLERGFNYSYFGLKRNTNYCKDHRRYFVNNPATLYQNLSIYSEFWAARVRRVLIPRLGKDMYPNVGEGMKKAKADTIDLSPEINIFFTARKLSFFQEAGIDFSCTTQASNKISDNLQLTKKDNFTDAMRSYRAKYKTRPQCLTQEEYFPDSWVMRNKAQCKEFFKQFNSETYQQLKQDRSVVYMRKLAGYVHLGEGVFPVHEKEEAFIRKAYGNGTKCGANKHDDIMQYMVPNPLLLNGRKFDFRIFLFVASTNPVIAYYYDGNLKVSLHEYVTNSTEPGVFITNIALSKHFFDQAKKNGTYNGLTSEELRSKVHWTYDDLFNYLWTTGKITDPNWLDNHLRKEMKKMLMHVTRMTKSKLHKRSSINELFGVDLVMDEDLKLWFIEANQKPMIHGWTPEIVPYFDKLVLDMFEITVNLLRSRMRRIVNYVNEITRESDSYTVTKNGVKLNDLKERRQEFKHLSMNYFEADLVPSKENKFQLIVDENISGEGRYFGLTEECY